MRYFFITMVLISNNLYSDEMSEWDKVRERGLEPGKTYNISSGTAFFVAPGYLVTNEHVVHECLTISIRSDSVAPAPAELISYDPTHDLALLKTTDYSTDIAFIRANDGLQVNDELYVIGYPLTHSQDGSFQINQVSVKDLQSPITSAQSIEFSDKIEHGNSGGPIIDDSGNIVGVVQAKKNYYQLAKGETSVSPEDTPYKINGVGIGLGILESFLQLNNIVFQSRPSTDNHSADNSFLDYAEHFTVNVHCVHE